MHSVNKFCNNLFAFHNFSSHVTSNVLSPKLRTSGVMTYNYFPTTHFHWLPIPTMWRIIVCVRFGICVDAANNKSWIIIAHSSEIIPVSIRIAPTHGDLIDSVVAVCCMLLFVSECACVFCCSTKSVHAYNMHPVYWDVRAHVHTKSGWCACSPITYRSNKARACLCVQKEPHASIFPK